MFPSPARAEPDTPAPGQADVTYNNIDNFRAIPAVVSPEPEEIEPGMDDHVYEMIWPAGGAGEDSVIYNDGPDLPMTFPVPAEVHQPDETEEDYCIMGPPASYHTIITDTL